MMRRINIKEDMIKFFQNQPARFDRVVMRTRINIYTSLSLGRQCLQDMFKYFQNQKQLDLTEVRIITLGGQNEPLAENSISTSVSFGKTCSCTFKKEIQSNSHQGLHSPLTVILASVTIVHPSITNPPAQNIV